MPGGDLPQVEGELDQLVEQISEMSLEVESLEAPQETGNSTPVGGRLVLAETTVEVVETSVTPARWADDVDQTDYEGLKSSSAGSPTQEMTVDQPPADERRGIPDLIEDSQDEDEATGVEFRGEAKRTRWRRAKARRTGEGFGTSGSISGVDAPAVKQEVGPSKVIEQVVIDPNTRAAEATVIAGNSAEVKITPPGGKLVGLGQRTVQAAGTMSGGRSTQSGGSGVKGSRRRESQSSSGHSSGNHSPAGGDRGMRKVPVQGNIPAGQGLSQSSQSRKGKGPKPTGTGQGSGSASGTAGGWKTQQQLDQLIAKAKREALEGAMDRLQEERREMNTAVSQRVATIEAEKSSSLRMMEQELRIKELELIAQVERAAAAERAQEALKVFMAQATQKEEDLKARAEAQDQVQRDLIAQLSLLTEKVEKITAAKTAPILEEEPLLPSGDVEMVEEVRRPGFRLGDFDVGMDTIPLISVSVDNRRMAAGGAGGNPGGPDDNDDHPRRGDGPPNRGTPGGGFPGGRGGHGRPNKGNGGNPGGGYPGGNGPPGGNPGGNGGGDDEPPSRGSGSRSSRNGSSAGSRGSARAGTTATQRSMTEVDFVDSYGVRVTAIPTRWKGFAHFAWKDLPDVETPEFYDIWTQVSDAIAARHAYLEYDEGFGWKVRNLPLLNQWMDRVGRNFIYTMAKVFLYASRRFGPGRLETTDISYIIDSFEQDAEVAGRFQGVAVRPDKTFWLKSSSVDQPTDIAQFKAEMEQVKGYFQLEEQKEETERIEDERVRAELESGRIPRPPPGSTVAEVKAFKIRLELISKQIELARLATVEAPVSAKKEEDEKDTKAKDTPPKWPKYDLPKLGKFSVQLSPFKWIRIYERQCELENLKTDRSKIGWFQKCVDTAVPEILNLCTQVNGCSTWNEAVELIIKNVVPEDTYSPDHIWELTRESKKGGDTIRAHANKFEDLKADLEMANKYSERKRYPTKKDYIAAWFGTLGDIALGMNQKILDYLRGRIDMTVEEIITETIKDWEILQTVNPKVTKGSGHTLPHKKYPERYERGERTSDRYGSRSSGNTGGGSAAGGKSSAPAREQTNRDATARRPPPPPPPRPAQGAAKDGVAKPPAGGGTNSSPGNGPAPKPVAKANNVNQNRGYSSSNIRCYRCGEEGHISPDCPPENEPLKTWRGYQISLETRSHRYNPGREDVYNQMYHVSEAFGPALVSDDNAEDEAYTDDEESVDEDFQEEHE